MDTGLGIGIRLLDQVSRVNTALGSVDADMGSLVSLVGQIGIGVGGVAAIAMISAGAFTVLTSSGDPEKLGNGKEMITNALMGLALVVLALFVLEFLGWDLLGIGDLNTGGVPFNTFSP